MVTYKHRVRAKNRKHQGDQPDNQFTLGDIPGVDFPTPEEARADFDRMARESLGISGDEFLRRWDTGEYRPVPDTIEGRKIGRLVMLLPLVGRDS